MILDGWGKSPDPKVSAIDNANIPFINSLYTKYPSAQLRTDGLNVGLPDGSLSTDGTDHSIDHEDDQKRKRKEGEDGPQRLQLKHGGSGGIGGIG